MFHHHVSRSACGNAHTQASVAEHRGAHWRHHSFIPDSFACSFDPTLWPSGESSALFILIKRTFFQFLAEYVLDKAAIPFPFYVNVFYSHAIKDSGMLLDKNVCCRVSHQSHPYMSPPSQAPANMPLQPKFLSETPRKVKTASVPRQVRGFDVPSLKESFHSELSDSIFNEGMLLSSYDGDIIADCWFPDNILPVVPNTELLITLTGPDRQPLYDSMTKQWDPRYLPLVLQKATPQGRHRLAPGQEERELSLFMVAVMDALMHHHNCDNEHSSTTSVLQESEASSPIDLPLRLRIRLIRHPPLPPLFYKKRCYLPSISSPPVYHPVLRPRLLQLPPPHPTLTHLSIPFHPLQDHALVVHLHQGLLADQSQKSLQDFGPHQPLHSH